ncbi:hypothetical protein CDAR_164111 [Caerostris darwini]|uniref:Granulin n=1 Tax=Caerostris darwini TaxID=1538125 RepID=A0AAV4UA80_9ARAC|nr:hypothetical protein CDAR_164111 [Caerostris darwini]
MICSDGKACPEGTKCCTTFEGQIKCCDLQDFDSKFVKTKKALRIVSAGPSYDFVNISAVQNAGYCFEGITCNGKCCGTNCCKFKYGEFCETLCCNILYKCCGSIDKLGKEWCCKNKERCGVYIEDVCLDKGSSLVAPLYLVLIAVSIRMLLLNMLIH